MTTMNDLAHEFLAQPVLAVVGLSAARELPGNAIYDLLKQRGHTVYAVSPSFDTFHGDPCYPTLAALPSVPGGVVIAASPDITLAIAQQCIDTGVTRVWMHDMRGPTPKFAKESGQTMTSVSDEAVRLLHAHGVTVIPGGCPRQFDGDFGHKCMRWMLQVMGALELPETVTAA